jgi:hypothetical protein
MRLAVGRELSRILLAKNAATPHTYEPPLGLGEHPDLPPAEAAPNAATMHIVMSFMSDTEILAIEQRAARALDVAPAPWTAQMETRQAIGGCSFIPVTDDQAVDEESYVDVHLRTGQLTSPDARLDDILDFIAHAATDIPRLIAEIRRMHGQAS